MFALLDQACHPKVMSWVAAVLVSAMGAVYPACLHVSKPDWVMIGRWVMLAIHVLSTAMKYYDYLLEKGFSHKSVHPLPPPVVVAP